MSIGRRGAFSLLALVLIGAAAAPLLAQQWVRRGIGDCSGRDVGSTRCTAAPSAAYCTGATVGQTAVCWDGAIQVNGSEAWCTYKTVRAADCTGGGRPGYVYECVGTPDPPQGSGFAGVWDTGGSWGDLTLEGTTRITGSYTCCGQGVVEGQVSGSQLRATWTRTDGAGGEAVMWLEGNDRLVGTWCYGRGCDPTQGSKFEGTRKR